MFILAVSSHPHVMRLDPVHSPAAPTVLTGSVTARTYGAWERPPLTLHGPSQAQHTNTRLDAKDETMSCKLKGCTVRRYGRMDGSSFGMGWGASCSRALSTTHTATSPATGRPAM